MTVGRKHLMLARWPEAKPEEDWEQAAIDKFVNGTIEHSRAFRTLKTEMNIPVNQPASGTIIATKDIDRRSSRSKRSLIAYSSSLKELEIFDAIPDAEEYKQYHSSSIAATGSLVFLKTGEIMADEKMQEKLQRELKEADSQIQRLEKLLASDFSKKAPAQVVGNERKKLETYRQTVEKIKNQIK